MKTQLVYVATSPTAPTHLAPISVPAGPGSSLPLETTTTVKVHKIALQGLPRVVLHCESKFTVENDCRIYKNK